MVEKNEKKEEEIQHKRKKKRKKNRRSRKLVIKIFVQSESRLKLKLSISLKLWAQSFELDKIKILPSILGNSSRWCVCLTIWRYRFAALQIIFCYCEKFLWKHLKACRCALQSGKCTEKFKLNCKFNPVSTIQIV